MYDATDPRPPLPEWILECYELLRSPEPDGSVRSIPRKRAVEILLEADELALEPEDANHSLARLIERGYLYEVGDELRVTVPAE